MENLSFFLGVLTAIVCIFIGYAIGSAEVRKAKKDD